jgi:SAM-dependent methyltransferase
LPQGGSVLDIGVGGGGTSLPLARRAGLIVGVDAQPDMLEGFLANAAAAGVAARAVAAAWPADAADVEVADVVVAGHVLYNTSDLVPFAESLSDHARLRVVVELTDRHPLYWMRDLWSRFHGLERPTSPTAADAEAVLNEVGLDTGGDQRVISSRHGGGGFARREDAIHVVRKRLCLSADRDDEIAEALGKERLRRIDGVWDIGPAERTVVTIWWDPRRARST